MYRQSYMKRRLVTLSAATFVVSLVALAWIMYPTTPLVVEHTFTETLDEAGLETLKRPTRIQAFRIKADLTNRPDDPHDYEVLSEAVPVPTTMAAKIVNLLITLKTFVGDPKVSCIPLYGVRLVFLRDDDRVDVFLCFECQLLLVAHNGVVTGGEGFGEIHGELLRAAKALFPKDREIQDLKTDWERLKSRFW